MRTPLWLVGVATLGLQCGGAPLPPSAATPSTASAEPVATQKAPALDTAPSASQGAAPSTDTPAASPPLSLRLAVTATKTSLTSEEAKDLRLSFAVTNTGTSAVKAELRESLLLVNGKPHKGFREALADIKDSKWDSLAPGDTARFHYGFSMRGAVKPGDYTFVLQVGKSQSEPLIVHVTP